MEIWQARLQVDDFKLRSNITVLAASASQTLLRGKLISLQSLCGESATLRLTTANYLFHKAHSKIIQ